ncbi:MAG TPA: hypothetical protein ENN29_09575 [Candidatus Hydrogenedentes bacterium]|nr:hypothetical protein [Candidatus Hydrogenedentota bacterium]
MLSTHTFPLFVMLVSGLGIAGCSTLAAEEAPPLRLACRLANYGPDTGTVPNKGQPLQDIALAHIRDMGLKYVFLSIPKPEEVDGVLAQLKEYGLEALVVRGDTDLSTEESVAELASQAAVCERLGARYMFLSPKRHGAPKEIVYERLRRAGEAAAKHGVIIALETHPDLGTNGGIHVETMKAIDHPNVRVNYDTANITYYNENTDAVAELKKCIDYVATVEVKDHNAELESWFFPALGEGVVDFPAIFNMLRAHGYTGPVTLEVEGVKGVEWSVEDRKKAMEDSVAYLRGIENFE